MSHRALGKQFAVVDLAHMVGPHANNPVAERYADSMRHGEWDWEDTEAHPVTVLTRRGQPHALYDGNHRVLAAHRAGVREVPGYAVEIGDIPHRGMDTDVGRRVAQANPGGWYAT